MGLRLHHRRTIKLHYMALVIGALLFVSAPVVGTLAQVANAVQGAAPSAPTGGLPNNSAIRTNDFYFTWNASTDANAVTYQFQSSMNPAVNAQGVLTTSVWHSGTLPTPQIHSTGAPDGTWYWQVRAIDAAGNVGNWSQVWKVTIDTIAPNVPQNGTPNNSSVDTNDFYFNWSASSDATPVTYQFQSSGSSAVDTNGSLVSPWQSWVNGNSEQKILNSPMIHSTGAPNGTYYWQVRAVDAAGNKSAWSSVWKMSIVPDTTGPTVQITNPTASSYVKGTVAISGTVTDSHPDHYYLVVENSTGKVVAGPGTVYQKQVQDWQWDTTKLLDGTYTIVLGARDAIGNKGPQSTQTLKVTVANDPPVPTIALTSAASPTASTDMTFEGTAKPSVAGLKQLELQIDGKDYADITKTVDPTTDKWSYTLLGGLDKGSHTISVIATDAAGNVSAETADSSVGVTVSGYAAPTSDGKGLIDSSLAPQPISQTVAPAQPAAIVIASATPSRSSNSGSTVHSAVPAQQNPTSDSSVLGAESSKSPATLSASTAQPITPSANGWTFFGIAWYWWLLLLALMIGVGSWAKVAMNRRRETA